QASDRLVAAVTGGTGTVGVRVSTGEVASLLVSGLGQALTATSANRSGEAPAESAREVVRALRDGLDLVLDGGQTPGGLPSTVVDARGEKLSLIREGRIAAADLASALA
ncbi:MAG TPA: Sua5/YciO/YrdC/YwlC family protein, partial [Nitrospiria bacterium]|nr:Sua5/YciO/YrdC/YwlC family protein [Nitrospiria bacterium]